MTIAQRLQTIRQTIADTANQCGRKACDIRLVAVSKGQSIAAIVDAYQAGVTEFAESYWQEAREKIQQLAHLPITWHFIGAIQSNKTKAIAQHFSWVQSVSSAKIAQLLSKHRPAYPTILNVCLEVNLDNEINKSGSSVEELHHLIQEIDYLPNLKLKGLMTIPKPSYNENEQYVSFLRFATLFNDLNRDLTNSKKMTILSMGMSDDYVAAIRAGSTMLRIGQGIFGARQK